MREERLVLHPFEDLKIYDYRSVQEANEHAWAWVEGMIPFEQWEEYRKAGGRETWVQVIAVSEAENRILFYGVVEQLDVKIEDQTCNVSLRLCSGTRLMDYKEHIRSFQDKDFSYDYLLDTCGREYINWAKIMTEGKGRSIGELIVQYRETDWEFIKRLASMNHTMVFADCYTKGEKYHFGIPERPMIQEEISGEFHTRFYMGECWEKRNQGLAAGMEDAMTYVWKTREIHKLGERKVIDGRDLYIWKIETRLEGNELYHTYSMKPRSGFRVPFYHNSRAAGVSLMGNVLDVRDEKVQIRLWDDENKQGAGAKWFSFSTVYSSADGTGWYCMPEIGDAVRLYFPTPREKEAYVASTYHEERAGLRTRPECKSWRNRQGKEIRLSPGRILMTNNDGTYIELSDEKGIEMVSAGSVTVRAGGDVSITSANSYIELDAPRKIRLRQGNTEMKLGGDINLEGARIRL